MPQPQRFNSDFYLAQLAYSFSYKIQFIEGNDNKNISNIHSTSRHTFSLSDFTFFFYSLHDG